jgi:Zn-dependent metalloprotease
MVNSRLAALRLTRGDYKVIAGRHYRTPKELWHIRTSARADSPERIARDFIVANAALFKLEQGVSQLAMQRLIRSLGATHVIFRQIHNGYRVHRGYLTVHVDLSGRVYLCKNRSVPPRLLPAKFDKHIDRHEAVRRARHALPKRDRISDVRGTERLWFPREDELVPAWKVRLTRVAPREEWIIYLSARNGAILNKYDNLAGAVRGRGQVFDPSPVTALGDHALLLNETKKPRRPPPVAYREVILQGLDGGGTLAGEKVTTAPTRAMRVRKPDLQFLLLSHEHGFEEVMVYYHVDSALRYLERLGYNGARAIFRDPVKANVNGTRDDNSWYSPVERMLTFGTGDIDDAEDAETILHELGHAIQDAICPDFGQSAEAAAMGEGFGDYFAASFFEARKPPRYRSSVMSWDGLLSGLGSGDNPPCLRRVDSPHTYRNFRPGGDEHVNGQIWSATLWDVRALLGREKADRIILESHFQLDGFTDFARGARAILDADRNLEGARHAQGLKKIFRRRKIAPV